MFIRKGIKLIIQSHNLNQRIFINDGVKKGSTISNNGALTYDKDAYVPVHSWRTLSDMEREIVLADDSVQHYSSSILIDKLPDYLCDLLKQVNVGDCQDFTSVLNAFKSKPELVSDIQSELVKLLHQYSRDHSELLFHRIVFNPPGIETLTYFIEDKKLNFVGFHVDRSMECSFSNVEDSLNRICINIGSEDRIVYYINLSLNSMYLMLKELGKYDMVQITTDNIGTYFFRQFPDYPVIKIIQAPYEFYIMPTDNVLHDGSSLDRIKHDICLVYLGFLNTSINCN